MLVRTDRSHSGQPLGAAAAGLEDVTLGAACALAFLAALPQLCSP
jgi:hypothetical protein